jgi:hypothetical protein
LLFAELSRVPCRDEWLLSASHTLPDGQVETRLQRVSLDPALIGPSRIEALAGFADFSSVDEGPGGCDEPGWSELLLVYRPEVGRSVMRRWRVNHETGAVEVPGSGREVDLQGGLTGARGLRAVGSVGASADGDADTALRGGRSRPGSVTDPVVLRARSERLGLASRRRTPGGGGERGRTRDGLEHRAGLAERRSSQPGGRGDLHARLS